MSADSEREIAEWREECRAARASWAQAVADESSTPVINMAEARLRRAETRYEATVRADERAKVAARCRSRALDGGHGAWELLSLAEELS